MEPSKQNENEPQGKAGNTEEVSVSEASSESENILQVDKVKSLKPRGSRRRVIIIAACVVVLLAASVIAVFIVLRENDASKDGNQKTVETSMTDSNEDSSKASEQERRIYFAEGSTWNNLTLYSVEPYSKDLKKIDEGLRAGSGAAGAGSDSPLNSPDFLKAAYIKDDNIWLAGERLTPEKIEQPSITTTGVGYYTQYLTAWSSDSNRLVYVIRFSCPIHSSTECSQDDENEELTGVYVYDLSKRDSLKLPISNAEQWIPRTSKIVYFETNPENSNQENMRAYDLETNLDEVISVAPFGFGVQLTFSDDGSRIIYSEGVNGTQASEMVAADTDNSNQTFLERGTWAQLQKPLFLSNSTNNYVYIEQVSELCDGGGLCPRSQLTFVVDGKLSTAGDVRSGPIGNFDDYVVVLTGSSVYPYNEPTEIDINLENYTTTRAESSIYSTNYDATEDGDIFLGITKY